MNNSWLSNVSELVYTENAVPYLLSGKAVYGVLRVYQMIEIALHTIILENIIGSIDIDSSSICQLPQKGIDSKLDVTDISSVQVIKLIK